MTYSPATEAPNNQPIKDAPKLRQCLRCQAGLPIGGLKEKLLAALRGGLKTVVIPQDNEKDLAEIPNNVKHGLTIVATESVDEMLEHTLISRPTAIEWIEPEEVEHVAEHSGVVAH